MVCDLKPFNASALLESEFSVMYVNMFLHFVYSSAKLQI